MNPGVEIIDFTRPDGSRKNLFITNIPGVLHEDDVVIELRKIFDPFGLVYGAQVYPTQWKTGHKADNTAGETTSGYYAFVTFYSANAATKAKDELKGVVILGDQECKLFEDKDNVEETENIRTVKYVCLIELKVLD
ncbi:uncharacterized protein LOC132734970, partial [Ruditapes philippinarum]|uniref:uncharacterized protein LOC132734970 n=1 Tax=Ruditapes philippinarum TaxID=129788 RepID=UPI00295AD582